MKTMPFRPQNVRLFYDKNRTQHNTSIAEMKLWKSKRDKRLIRYRVINKITPRLLKCVSALKLTAAECVVGDPGWQLSTHPAAPSLCPQVGWGKKIGRRETRKLEGLNKDTDSAIEKQR